MCCLIGGSALAVKAQPPQLPSSTTEQNFVLLQQNNAPYNTGSDVAVSSTNPATRPELRAVVIDGYRTSPTARPVPVLRCQYRATPTSALLFPAQQLLGAGLTATIDDPDVVISRSIEGNQTWNMLVVYRATPPTGPSHIYCELWRYNVGANTLTSMSGPTQVDNADPAPALSPNVDACAISGNQSIAVITYEKKSSVYYRTRIISGGSAYPLLPAGGAVPIVSGYHSRPDVALGMDTDLGQLSAVFVAVDRSIAGKQRVRWMQAPLTDIQAGSAAVPSTLAYYGASGDSLGPPRVTAAENFGYGFAAVFARTKPSTALYEVQLLSGNAMWGFSGLPVISSNNMTDHEYDSPVVAPVLDGYSVMVAWHFLTLGWNAIEGRQVGSSYTLKPVYVIGDSPTGPAQVRLAAPSVAGIPATVSPVHNMFYAWAYQSATASSARYRTSELSRTFYRPLPSSSAASGSVQVVPNPATTTARLLLTPGAHDERITEVAITELLTGRLVRRQAGQGLAADELPLTDVLPAGLRTGQYLIRVTTTRGVYTTRCQYTP